MRRANKSLIMGAIFGVAIAAIAISVEIKNMSAAVFLNPVAFMIVFGGTVAAALISMPLREISKVLKRTYYAIAYPKDNFIPTLREIVKVSVGTNKDIMYLEKGIKNIRNAMLKDGLNYISMGFKSEDIRRFLEIKKEQNENALAECSILYMSLGKIGPAFGLLGTLVGLIVMLYFHMGDGDTYKVASSMGVALTATLYGVGLSNLLFNPLGEYMQYNAQRCAELDNMIIEGVIQIKDRKHPVYLIQALKAYLPRENYNVLDEIMKEEMLLKNPEATSKQSGSDKESKAA